MSTPAQVRLHDHADMLQTGAAAAVAGAPGMALVNPAEDGSLQFLSQGGILSAMTKMVMDSVGADGICIAYAEQGSVVCRASCGDVAPAIGTPLNVKSGIGAQCLREGKTTTCTDTETDPRVNREVCRRIGVRSILAVPLRLNSAVIGIAQAFYAAPSGFSQANLLELEQSAGLFVSVLPLPTNGEDSEEAEPAVEAPTTSLCETPPAAPKVEVEMAEEAPIVASEQEIPHAALEQTSPNESREFSDPVESQSQPIAESLTPQASEPAWREGVADEARSALSATPAKLAPETAFTSLAQIEEPAWWKRPTLPAVALAAVIALVWVTTHSSSHPLVPLKPANTAGALERPEIETASVPFSQLLNKARAGDSNAQFALAKRYETDKGAAKNLTKAYSWYIVAAEAGNEAARQAIRPLTSKLTAAQLAAVRFEVARMYANGIGVRRRDPVAAYAWMVLAEAAGDRRAKAEQNALAASMRPHEIAEAQTRASYWLKSRGYSTQ